MTTASAASADLASNPHPLEFDCRSKSLIAVVCHVYYLSLWDELAEQIAQIPADFDLHVTITDQPGALDLVEKIRIQHPAAQTQIVTNHGRDIFPFVSVLNSGALDDYYLICKLHTKTSPHRKDGEYWRRKLLYGLLGSPENVADILRGFNASPELGIVAADGEIYEGDRGWKDNRKRCHELAQSVGICLDDYPARLACGSFFWARGSVLRPLRALSLSASSFEPENGALDGTTEHAVERLFSIFAMAEGYSVIERSRI
jgi:lipopolysaccharide biosynthesis protein